MRTRHEIRVWSAGFMLASIIGVNAGVASAADPSNGVLSGFALTWNGTAANTDSMWLEPGEAFVAANQIVSSGLSMNLTQANNNLADGVVLGADTVYYGYLLYDPLFPAPHWTCVFSDQPPTMDGLGPAGLKKSGHGGANASVFIGSVLSDNTQTVAGVATPHVVPFIRAGDEVILNPVNIGCDTGDFVPSLPAAGGEAVNSLTNANQTASVTFAEAPGGPVSCNGTNALGQSALLTYPQSASAMLADVVIDNGDTAQNAVYIAPPVPVPAAGVPTNSQLYLVAPPDRVNGVAVVVISYQQRLRPTMVAGPGGHLVPSFGVVALNPVPVQQTLQVNIAYRGYVEAIGHLNK
jgi:hypothetical protein